MPSSQRLRRVNSRACVSAVAALMTPSIVSGVMMFFVGATLVEDFVVTDGIPARPVGFSGGRKAEEVLGVNTKKSAKRKIRAIMMMDGWMTTEIDCSNAAR